MEKLSDMPNIGAGLEKKLHSTPVDLLFAGSSNAFRLYTLDTAYFVCAGRSYSRYRWHEPDTLKKQELLHLMHAVNRDERGI